MLPGAAASVHVCVHVCVLWMNGDVQLLHPVSGSLRALTSITHISFPSSAAALTLPPPPTHTPAIFKHPPLLVGCSMCDECLKPCWNDISGGSFTTNCF